MKYIVYSTNIGGYDLFNKPSVYDKNIRYILFTDNKHFRSDVWEVQHIDFLPEMSNRKKARYIKINPHLVLPKHDVSIWIDHCFKPKFDNINTLIKNIGFIDKDIMIYKHSWRNCTYDESIEVLNQKLDSKTLVKSQMDRYLMDGFPKNYGLFETGLIFRKNNQSINNFNNFWWSELNNGSERDQLSLMYSSWKNLIEIKPITYGKSCYNNLFLDKKIKHQVRVKI